MKKTFPLNVEGKHPERLLEAIKHEIRKYLKRERSRPVPADAHFWDFDCRFGPSADQATPVQAHTINTHINALVAAGGTQFYVEILAKPGIREPRPEGLEAESATEAEQDD